MAFDIQNRAETAAKVLDNNPESKAAEHFRAELQQAGGREEKRQFVETVDSLEQDGTGLDLVIKKDDRGKPQSYAVIPALWRQAAKEMARAMDENDADTAWEYNELIQNDIRKGKHNERDAELKYDLFSIAVDAYEKDDVGLDVKMGYGNGATSKPFYNFNLNRIKV